jgi:Sap-like sulfolipid-1-addressing protein
VVIDLVLIGIVVALDPLPLTAYIVVLDSKRGTRKGAAFIFGWLCSLAAVLAVTVAATGNNPPKPNTAPSLASLAVKILIGVGLVGVAVRQRRRQGRPKKPKPPPKWQAGVDNMSPWFAIGLAPLLQPWGLVAAGVATVTQAHLGTWQDYVSLLAFCLIGTSSYIAMELYAIFRPERASAMLTSIRSWITTHTDQAIFYGALGLGFWLIGQSAYFLIT